MNRKVVEQNGSQNGLENLLMSVLHFLQQVTNYTVLMLLRMENNSSLSYHCIFVIKYCCR